jgi:hypothetical protein
VKVGATADDRSVTFGYDRTEMQSRRRLPAIALNLGLRLAIAYFLAEVMRKPNDPRFAGKAIPLRNLLIVGSFSFLFPALHFWRRPWKRYPWLTDSAYLSIYALDMAGNSFNLYDRYYHFDLIPHTYGSAALMATLLHGFGLSPLAAFGTANTIHLLLELQEYYTDVLFGTHNVRGIEDSMSDLGVGVIGTTAYVAAYGLLLRRNPLRPAPEDREA